MFEKPEKRKSRNIPLMEYYEVLQMEFMSYYLRYLYYIRAEDKEKYLDFCKKKKESIEKLSLRNNFMSIFDSDKHRDKYLSKFFNEFGLPNMSYRDDYQKSHLGFWDKKYFFKEGSSVTYRDSEWVILDNMCKFIPKELVGDSDTNDFLRLVRPGKPPIKVNISEVNCNNLELFKFKNL